MICRIAFHEKLPGSVEDPRAQQFRDWIKAQPGFVAGWHGEDETTGRGFSFSVWETEGHLEALKDRVPPGGPIGMKPGSVETYTKAVAF